MFDAIPYLEKRPAGKKRQMRHFILAQMSVHKKMLISSQHPRKKESFILAFSGGIKYNRRNVTEQ
uniref:Uncharacterized protein n=1 Tax=Romanomermis culicivorax TaxID=13658 RepID=A0A915JW19_ROMCU